MTLDPSLTHSAGSAVMQKIKQVLHKDKSATVNNAEHPKASNMVDITVFKGTDQGRIVKSTTSKELGPRDVLIRVTHSGLCFTDYRKSALGCMTRPPLPSTYS